MSAIESPRASETVRRRNVRRPVARPVANTQDETAKAPEPAPEATVQVAEVDPAPSEAPAPAIDTPTNVANTMYNRHRSTIDVGGSVRLTNRFTLLFSGRNIRSEPVITMQKNGSNPAVAQTYEVTGTIWTFGIKGVW